MRSSQNTGININTVGNKQLIFKAMGKLKCSGWNLHSSQALFANVKVEISLNYRPLFRFTNYIVNNIKSQVVDWAMDYHREPCLYGGANLVHSFLIIHEPTSSKLKEGEEETDRGGGRLGVSCGRCWDEMAREAVSSSLPLSFSVCSFLSFVHLYQDRGKFRSDFEFPIFLRANRLDPTPPLLLLLRPLLTSAGLPPFLQGFVSSLLWSIRLPLISNDAAVSLPWTLRGAGLQDRAEPLNKPHSLLAAALL